MLYDSAFTIKNHKKVKIKCFAEERNQCITPATSKSSKNHNHKHTCIWKALLTTCLGTSKDCSHHANPLYWNQTSLHMFWSIHHALKSVYTYVRTIQDTNAHVNMLYLSTHMFTQCRFHTVNLLDVNNLYVSTDM